MRLIKNIVDVINDRTDLLNLVRLQQDDTYVLTDQEQDITSYQYIEDLFICGRIDYKLRKRAYIYLGASFSSQDDITKTQIATLCAAPTNVLIPYYMGKGMSMQQASYTYLVNRSLDITKGAECCAVYISSPKFIKTILLYLPIGQAEKFLDDIRELSIKYKDAGHYGKKYGDTTDGIFDFIESYGTYENTGLVSYTLNPGMTLNNFVRDIMDILYNGNYE